jgi:tellurite resistance protein TerB
MALDWLKTNLSAARNSVAQEVAKLKNRTFLEATIAGVVVVAYADGLITPDEKQKMMGFVQRHEALKVFDTSQIIDLFKKYAENYDFDRGIGESQALEAVGKVKKNESEARLLVRVCCVIGAADGNFDDDEKAAVRRICGELGLNPSEFDL